MQKTRNIEQQAPAEKAAQRCQNLGKPSQKAQEVISRLVPFEATRIEDFDPLYQDLPVLGPFKYKNGDTYVGQYKEGKRTGFGRQVSSDGFIYEGYWENDQREKFGRAVNSDGDYYVGEWKDGKQDGWGHFHAADGTKYLGEWKAGEKHGWGCYQLLIKYLGEFVAGSRSGWGVSEIPNRVNTLEASKTINGMDGASWSTQLAQNT